MFLGTGVLFFSPSYQYSDFNNNNNDFINVSSKTTFGQQRSAHLKVIGHPIYMERYFLWPSLNFSLQPSCPFSEKRVTFLMYLLETRRRIPKCHFVEFHLNGIGFHSKAQTLESPGSRRVKGQEFQ